MAKEAIVGSSIPGDYTEHIDYFSLPPGSIWGKEGPLVLSYIEQANPTGKWLNLAAGDGRYFDTFAESADEFIVADKDPHALLKGRDVNSKPENRHKIVPVPLDLTANHLPFANQSFDGVFSLGALHFFNEKTLRNIFNEIDRILVPNGRFLFNMSTNIQRTRHDNQDSLIFPAEPLYVLEDAEAIVQSSFTGYSLDAATVAPWKEEFTNATEPYTFSADIILRLYRKQERST